MGCGIAQKTYERVYPTDLTEMKSYRVFGILPKPRG
jgi:hypothetical protein